MWNCVRNITKQYCAQLPLLLSLGLYHVSANADGNDVPHGAYDGDPVTITAPMLKIFSLNLAHGRKDGLNQIFLAADTFRKNLREIGVRFKQLSPHIISLQEADGPSLWSGRFDHVEYLAEYAEFPYYASARHSSTPLFQFGTALMAKVPMQNVRSVRFSPSPPTLRKGFLVASVPWNPDERLAQAVTLSVVSVHLDFSRRKVRAQQVRELIDFLKSVPEPFVLTGDLNADWTGEDPTVRDLVRALDLRVYEPHSTSLGTYNSTGKRLDWILISSGLKYEAYTVIPENLSDHLPVSARISLN